MTITKYYIQIITPEIDIKFPSTDNRSEAENFLMKFIDVECFFHDADTLHVILFTYEQNPETLKETKAETLKKLTIEKGKQPIIIEKNGK